MLQGVRDGEAGGGEGRPAEGDREPAEGERQAGVHAGRSQPRVQAAALRASPAAAAAAAAAVRPAAAVHAPRRGLQGPDEPGGGEAGAGRRRRRPEQTAALRHQAHLHQRRRRRRLVLPGRGQPEHAGGGGVHPGHHAQRPQPHIHLPQHAGAGEPLTLLRVLLQGPPAEQQQRRGPVLRLPQLPHPPGPLRGQEEVTLWSNSGINCPFTPPPSCVSKAHSKVWTKSTA
ncbi:hypothetical protein OJAV_G00210330 [Oryzias javanicus]|uniref:Uncharacterized protein n=1 Tax=Oryzias javanicus TaxID=123683 RepID=A0A3S2PNT0_ORYJA|nr:hypothetical protein OJAV_G00210330 [Oryzias javanicus]